MNVTLSFEPKTLDYIAQVLAARPYAEVAAVLADIQQQVQAQQPQQRPAPPVLPLDAAIQANGADRAPTQ